MTLHALLPLVNFVANIVLASFILLRNPKARTNRLYAALTLAVAYMCMLKFAWRLVPDAETALSLFQISFLGVAFVPTLHMDFVLSFVEDIDESVQPRCFPRWMRRTAWVLSGVFALCAFIPGAVAVKMELRPAGWSPAPGVVFAAYSALLLATMSITFVALSRAWARSRHDLDNTQRSQLTLLFVAVIVPLVVAMFTDMLLPRLGIYGVPELGELLSTASAGVFAVAMVRNSLLSAKVADASDAIVATMGDALFVVNHQDEIIFANEASSRLLGVSGRAILGEPISRFVRAPAGGALPPVGVNYVEGELLSDVAIPVMLSISRMHLKGHKEAKVYVAKDLRWPQKRKKARRQNATELPASPAAFLRLRQP